jgi:hypothetical protein
MPVALLESCMSGEELAEWEAFHAKRRAIDQLIADKVSADDAYALVWEQAAKAGDDEDTE